MSTDPIVIAFSGQSNCMGNPLCTDGPFYSLGGVQVYDAFQNHFENIDLAHVAHWCTDTQVPGTNYGHIGVGVNNIIGGLGYQLYQMTGGLRPIYFIVNGRGGTPISYWVGDGASSVRYVNLKHDVESALALLGLSTIDAFLFQQGESDMLDGRTTSQYIADHLTLFSQLRAESWFPATTPILCGRPCQQWATFHVHEETATAGQTTIDISGDAYNMLPNDFSTALLLLVNDEMVDVTTLHRTSDTLLTMDNALSAGDTIYLRLSDFTMRDDLNYCVDYLTSDADAYTQRVLSDGLPSQSSALNNIHFSGDSLHELGTRYADVLMNYGIGVYRRHFRTSGLKVSA